MTTKEQAENLALECAKTLYVNTPVPEQVKATLISVSTGLIRYTIPLVELLDVARAAVQLDLAGKEKGFGHRRFDEALAALKAKGIEL